MIGAEILAWIIIGYFLLGSTWDAVDPDAIKLTINSWPRAVVALAAQLALVVGAASVLALSTLSCILLFLFYIVAIVAAASRG